MKKINKFLTGFASVTVGLSALTGGNAMASTFTSTSPTNGGLLDSNISPVGGIVLDLIGQNDVRVTAQLAASSLFQGFASSNPFTIGTLTGFNSSITSVLGGGLKQVAVRVTLWDGDTVAGDFDFQQNWLQLNGLDFGNWSNVIAENTDGNGNTLAGGFSSGGFRNNILDTGWFFNSDSTTLSNLFTSLVGTQQVVFSLSDLDPGDNYFDFTQGINVSQINTGTGPTIGQSTTVPEAGSTKAILAVAGICLLTYRKRKNA